MEEALLKDMIHERDKKISQLIRKVADVGEKMEKAKEEFESFRSGSTQTKLERRREIAALVKARDLRLANIQRIEREVRNQSVGSLHLYADILKETAPESIDSSYVVRMQAQLCKAMHSMGILEHQLAIVNSISSEEVKSQKDSITAVQEDKSKMELEVMNQLMAIDNVKRQAEEECKSNLEQEQLRVVELRQELGIDDDADGSDSESHEEDEYEMEVRKGLAELKEMISEMERENEKQLETIESLKAQIEALKVPDTPDDGGDDDEQEDIGDALHPEENGNSKKITEDEPDPESTEDVDDVNDEPSGQNDDLSDQ